MDAIALSLQRHPRLGAALRRVRGMMIWSVKRFLPQALQRRELLQARVVMADAPPQPAEGQKALFMSFRAWTSHVAWETTIAQALRHRGARCEFFFCGSGLPICEIGWPAEENNKPCEFCAPYVAAMIDAASFPRTALEDVVPEKERRAILAEVGTRVDAGEPVALDGLALDEIVEQSLIWHFRTGTLADTAEVRRARRDFLVGAAIMARAAPRLLDQVTPDVIVMVNGLFFEERIVREAALARGIRVVTYEVGVQSGTLFFSDTAPAPDYDISDLWELDGQRVLREEEDRRLEEILQGRSSGKGLARRFYGRTTSISRRAGRPLFALFSNVSWDTAVTGKSFAFPSMFDWIIETIRLAQSHPDLDLVVRVHPAETRWPRLESRERVADIVAREFPNLPANVRIVSPEESVNSYALMDAADAVLVFSSTVGLEAAARGKSVCVAGKTHYRDKGFTFDVTNPEGYVALFDDLGWISPNARHKELARCYAYLLFCRAIIPFRAVTEEEPSEPVFRFARVSDLVPGQDAMLDLVADGILNGSSFRLGPDSERVGSP